MSKGIVWSAVSRDSAVLAEAGEDEFSGQVVKLAQKLLKKRPTAGWEFSSSRGLKGMKFHVFDESLTDGIKGDLVVWSFSAVAESSFHDDEMKSFLEKLVYVTEPMRSTDGEWRNGDVLCAQASFAPILLNLMEQASTQGKLAMVNDKISTTKDIMNDNIELALDRQETLEDLQKKSNELSAMAKQFKKKAKQIKRWRMMQNAKNGLIVGTAITGVAAAIVVPPLVALL